MVHAGGRPRIYDRSYIFKRLAAWAQLPTSTNINQFCSLPDIHISFDALWRFCNEEDELHEVYREAKAFIATNREEANSCDELSDAAYNKHLHVYDSAYRIANREEKLFDHELIKKLEKYKKNLEKEEEQGDPLKFKEKFDELIDQFSERRSKANTDCNNTSSDIKS